MPADEGAFSGARHVAAPHNVNVNFSRQSDFGARNERRNVASDVLQYREDIPATVKRAVVRADYVACDHSTPVLVLSITALGQDPIKSGHTDATYKQSKTKSVHSWTRQEGL